MAREQLRKRPSERDKSWLLRTWLETGGEEARASVTAQMEDGDPKRLEPVAVRYQLSVHQGEETVEVSGERRRKMLDLERLLVGARPPGE